MVEWPNIRKLVVRDLGIYQVLIHQDPDDWKDALRRTHSKRVRAYIEKIIANDASTPLTQALLRIRNMIPTAAYEAMEKSAREMFGCVDRDTIRTKVTNIMAVLDDVKETIPTGEYLKIATKLQYTFRSS